MLQPLQRLKRDGKGKRTGRMETATAASASDNAKFAAPGFEQTRQFGCDFVASISICVCECVSMCVCECVAHYCFCCGRCQTVRQPQNARPKNARNATNKA